MIFFLLSSAHAGLMGMAELYFINYFDTRSLNVIDSGFRSFDYQIGDIAFDPVDQSMQPTFQFELLRFHFGVRDCIFSFDPVGNVGSCLYYQNGEVGLALDGSGRDPTLGVIRPWAIRLCQWRACQGDNAS
jgi:hypothetical protein